MSSSPAHRIRAPPGRVQTLQPQADDGPVGPRHGHHVGHRAHGGQIAVFVKYRAPFPRGGHGHGQHQGHPHAGQTLEGVRAVRPVGVHHRGRRGQPRLAGVVVGDDHVHPKLRRQGGLLHRCDAAVHRDDESDPLFRQGVDRLRIQAVALSQAAGDVGNPLPAAGGQKLGQQAGGGDPVHVVVSVDGDKLLLLQGLPHPGRRPVHVPQQHGVRDGLRLRGQQPPDLRPVRHAPGGQ